MNIKYLKTRTGKEERLYSANTVIDDEVSTAGSESESESVLFEESDCPEKQ
ncbi:hypothetical protein DPMN_031578 [Dreissena polymorpha]|uniref:Uncharacterized protein n=1 Tax=Dreissena polymorpha TaxID=45954 RepID=A0A9D4M2K8_DREPO|nr:hypothetical protein DPMN_031578 [Dreissena polymorpha]